MAEQLHDNVGRVVPPTGFQPSKGSVTMAGLTAVNVSVPAITANSLILFSIRTGVGTIGLVKVNSITPGVGFSLVSLSALDTSVMSWMVFEP